VTQLLQRLHEELVRRDYATTTESPRRVSTSSRVIGAVGVRAASVADGARGPMATWIDTVLDSPQNITDWDSAPSIPGQTCESRSVVGLFAGLDPERQSAR